MNRVVRSMSSVGRGWSAQCTERKERRKSKATTPYSLAVNERAHGKLRLERLALFNEVIFMKFGISINGEIFLFSTEYLLPARSSTNATHVPSAGISQHSAVSCHEFSFATTAITTANATASTQNNFCILQLDLHPPEHGQTRLCYQPERDNPKMDATNVFDVAWRWCGRECECYN